MLVTICGESGAGKTELQKRLGHMGYKEIVPYSTRIPRPGEKDGVDYHFVSNEKFNEMINEGLFAEYEEYSQNRLYGTALKDARAAAESNEKYVIVVTPNGMRALEKELGSENILKVMVTASLGARVKRYIDRCTKDGREFNFDDMNEINARVNRDFGMFLNMERMVDMVLDNSLDAKTDPKAFGIISKLAEQVDLELELRMFDRIADYDM